MPRRRAHRYQPAAAQISAASLAASRAAAARQSSLGVAVRVDRPSATRVTSALDGPLVNARATSAGVAPCAPTPGQQQHRLRHRAPCLADRPRIGRADDRADAREAALADEVLSPFVHERGDVLP